MSQKHTYPALERLKQEADGIDVMIAVAPEWLEGPIEYVFEMDYLERKQEITDQRDTVRRQFKSRRNSIESMHGTEVNRALRRRADGEPPSLDIERVASDLTDAKQTIDALEADLDDEYLTVHEKQTRQQLKEDILDAREYIRTKRSFDQRKEHVAREIANFDDRWDQYRDRDQYMISSDENYLADKAAEIWENLSDMARELTVHVLPDEDAAWLSETKSQFGAYADAIPQYNESYVEQERTEYADVLTSEHGPLNDRQQKAVIRNDRRNLVDASAGTGKTLTLTHRFLYLLQKGVLPDRIVAITYMSDAAEEMKARIAAEAGVRENQVNISTIHAFALQICMEASGSYPDFDLGDHRDNLVDSYLEAAANDTVPQPNRYPEIYKKFYEAYKQFREVDSEAEYVEQHKDYYQEREEFITEKFHKFVEKSQTFDLSASTIRSKLDSSHAVGYAFGQAGAALVEAYEHIVDSESAPVDFADMIRTARQIVQDNPEEYGRRYDHILVDEYQDMSESTLKFVDALADASEDSHLFCVGDDWQSIMGFTGSNVRYFTEFEERYADVTYTSLRLNYRCPPKIVDAGCDLIAQSQADQNGKPVTAAADPTEFDDDRTMQLHRLDSLYEARAPIYAADRIEEAIDSGHDYDDVMVLSRNDDASTYMYELRQELESRGIPHTRPDTVRDYVPSSLEEGTEGEITFDGKLNAQFSDTGETPPLVTLQSAHSAKGTEAPIVIFLHAVGYDADGIPIDQRTDKLLEPATNITSKHIPEERRLFYVALTRAEEEFQAITTPGEMSPFINDIEEYFTLYHSQPDICGECVEFNKYEDSNRPYKATLDCGRFEADLFAWPDNDPPELVEGATYRLSNLETEKDDYGEEIRYDRSDIERVS